MTTPELQNVVREYLEKHEEPSIADFTRKNITFIKRNTPPDKAAEKFWPTLISNVAKKMNKTLVKSRVSWKTLFCSDTVSSPVAVDTDNNKISVSLPSDDHNASGASSSYPSSSSSGSLPTLKTTITEQDKDVLRERFKKFTETHKQNFWYLDSTKAQATRDKTDPISVEEKVMDFALKCNFYHPSQSLILDVTDKNWKKVFTEAELNDIKKEGGPLECEVPEQLKPYYSALNGMETSAGVFKYARTIEINDPSKERMKVWFSTALEYIAQLFLETGSFNITDMPETDQQYCAFGFFSTIFLGSGVVAKGTEVSSESSADAINLSRQLSAIDPIRNRKMGRRGDTIFKYGSQELGCSEFGAARNQTKAFHDCSMKMPLVLRDMLLSITYNSNLLHTSHVIGYSVTGGNASLLDVNIPAGFVTRVRKTEPLNFPHRDSNFVSRLLPLITLACTGKKILDETIRLLDRAPRPITLSTGGDHWCLPPNFTLSSTSSTTSSSSKRRRIAE